jgi:acyl dehydratase
MMTTFESVEQLGERVGREVGVSGWVEVSQARIDRFAEATEDRQWIHTDPERAARESPFKATVAHGFLTLSLLSELLRLAVSVRGVRWGVNYGLNRVRFVAPVPAGSRVRGRFRLAAFVEVEGGAQATWDVSVEREGDDRTCCVAEWLVRYYV